MKNSIIAFVKFWQSPKYPTDWGMQVEYKNGYTTVLKTREVKADMKFGEKPDTEKMQKYAETHVLAIFNGLGIDGTINFM